MVGMSTIPEVVVACEERIETLVLSLVTNAVVGSEGKAVRSIKEEVAKEVRSTLFVDFGTESFNSECRSRD